MTESEIKAAVRERDGYACTKCGMDNAEHRRKYKGKALDVHRLTPGSDYSVDVCVTLCKTCHSGEATVSRKDRDAFIPGLADKLRAAREAAGLSQQQAAVKSGMYQATIARYELNERVPTLGALYKLAEAYDVDVCKLLPPSPKKK